MQKSYYRFSLLSGSAIAAMDLVMNTGMCVTHGDGTRRFLTVSLLSGELTHFHMRHVNDFGRCAGFYGETCSPVRAGFMDIGQTQGPPRKFPQYSIAMDVSPTGDLLITKGSGNHPLSYIVSKERWKRLPDLGGVDCEAKKLTGSGDVVGSSAVRSGYEHAFLYHNGKITDLGTLGGAKSVAYSLNEAGVIVGDSYVNMVDRQQHACLWNGGRITDMGTLGGTVSSAVDVNSTGVIAGYSELSRQRADFTPLRAIHACIWQDGVIRDIQTIPSENSVAAAVNASGVVIGSMEIFLGTPPTLTTHAFAWYQGQMVDLNDLVDPNEGWKLESAMCINNRGQIIGYGNKGVYVLQLTLDVFKSATVAGGH